MSIIDAYRACLIELNKVLAPSLLLDDFVYLFNKAIQQYINKKYSLFEINQLATDDLRALTKSVKISFGNDLSIHSTQDVFGTSYDCNLPSDYFHILNVICEFKNIGGKGKCLDCGEDGGIILRTGASKLDTNLWPSVITNYYMRPSVKRPYYYIINIDDPEPNELYKDESGKREKIAGELSINNRNIKQRYGNSNLPIMQIKCGNDRANYSLQAVYVDYLRTPSYVYLDQKLLDNNEDKSQILEFADYIIYEIINETVKLAMENAKDERLTTFVKNTQSIPAQ